MERKLKPTVLSNRFEEGRFGHVKIYLEPIVRVYKAKSAGKESDRIKHSKYYLDHYQPNL